jgi:hypothetical protein
VKDHDEADRDVRERAGLADFGMSVTPLHNVASRAEMEREFMKPTDRPISGSPSI